MAALIDPSLHHLQLMMVPSSVKGLVQRFLGFPASLAASCLTAHQIFEALPADCVQG